MRRRSQLYVPANNPRMIAKAAAIEADSILFDFEDAVPPDEKESARRSLGAELRKADWGHRELGARINAPGTPDGERDLGALAAEPLVSMLVVPKAESDLSPLGKATGKALIPIIETARGVLHVEDVVRSGGVVAVTYGAGDLATSVGGDVEAYGRNIYVKTRLVIAAAAYGPRGDRPGVLRSQGRRRLPGGGAGGETPRLRREAGRSPKPGASRERGLHPDGG